MRRRMRPLNRHEFKTVQLFARHNFPGAQELIQSERRPAAYSSHCSNARNSRLAHVLEVHMSLGPFAHLGHDNPSSPILRLLWRSFVIGSVAARRTHSPSQIEVIVD